MISCGMDAYGKSVPSKQITPVRRHWQSTERQVMCMQHAYRVDECLLVCGQPSATWAELGSPRDKKIAMSTARKLLWLRHASADQARQLQAAVPSMDLEKASKSWLPRPSPGRTAATVITFDGRGVLYSAITLVNFVRCHRPAVAVRWTCRGTRTEP